ncbi:hypothetical protein [Vibrio phage BONAISHI]|nr:hypothetical protein [Vibrio phage BONAISHI]
MTESNRVPGLIIEGNDLQIPSGNTSDRPSSPKNGQAFSNNQTNTVDFFIDGSWVQIGRSGLTIAGMQATGFTAETGKIYPVDTRSGGITVTLPNIHANGDRIIIFDAHGAWHSNRCTVTSPDNINGYANDILLSKSGSAAEFIWFDDVGWVDINGIATARGQYNRWAFLTGNTHNVTIDTFYFCDTSSVTTDNMTINLPSDVNGVRTGQKIFFADYAGNLDSKPIKIANGGSTINLKNADVDLIKNGSAIELTAIVTSRVDWVITGGNVGSDPGSALDNWSEVDLNGSGNVLKAGNSYMIDTSAAQSSATLPSNPKVGDSIWIIDKAHTFDSKPLTLIRGDSAHYFDGKNVGTYVLRRRGMAVLITWSGADNPGWVFSAESRMWGHVSQYLDTGSGNVTPDFTGDVKSHEFIMTGNVNLLDPLVQEDQAVTFYVVFIQDSTGGHSITFPAGWLLAEGSGEVNSSPNGTTVVQGLILNGKTYYSITAYN